MGRILSIDYGRKRTGLAVTDPLKIIANGLATVSTSLLWDYLNDYLLHILYLVSFTNSLNI